MYVKINIVSDDNGGYTTELAADGQNVEILDALANAVTHACCEMTGGYNENMSVFTTMLLVRNEEVFADETYR